MAEKRGSRRNQSARARGSGKKQRRDPTPPSSTSSADEADIFPKTLGYPMVSPMDPKRYKIIQLENGLKAILISDCALPTQNSNVGNAKVKKDINCVDKRIAQFNKEIMNITGGRKTGDSKCCEPNPCLSENEKDDPAPETKKNERRVCGANRVNNKATVNLTVGAGSINDPSDYLGMAHFCEHMMILGSKKYPKPGEFDLFLTSNGGEFNAFTYSDTTLYYYDIDYDEEKFVTSLDMFVNFFISPKMTLKYVQKELELVESVDVPSNYNALEFKCNKENYVEKRMQILHTTGKAGHPICRFSWGNKLTLQSPDDQDQTIREVVREFQSQYYSSGHMTLSIEAPEPLAKIEEWVTTYFGQIVNNGIPKLSLVDQPMPYDTNEFKQFFSVYVQHDVDLLFVTWELPSAAWQDYRVKPMDYIARTLGSESPGSLGSYLQERHLIVGLDASDTTMGADKSESSVLFYILFYLTKLGMRNTEKILESTYGYIKYLIKQKPQEESFRELQSVKAIEFHFTDSSTLSKDLDSNSRLSKDLDKALRYFRPQHALIGNLIPLTWDPEIILQYFKMLVPSRANYMLMSKTIDFSDRVDPYFNTPYFVQAIPARLLERMENANIVPEFKPYVKNQFIPKNFCLAKLSKADLDAKTPRIVFKNEKLEFWHFVGELKSTSIHYYLHLMSTVGNECPQHAVMLEIFVLILQNALRSTLHGTNETSANHTIARSMMGLSICVNGFSHKLNLIMDAILEHLFHKDIFTSGDKFDAAKRDLLQCYNNDLVDPENLNRGLRLRITSDRNWMSNELIDALVVVKLDMFTAFAIKFKSRIQMIGFAQGNLSSSQAIRFARRVSKNITGTGVSPGSGLHPQLRAHQLPLGENILRVRNKNHGGKSSFISNYYQVGPEDPQSGLIIELIEDAMTEAAFHQLREVEKLAYSVSVEVKKNFGSTGLLISLHTQSDVFSGTYIKNRIDAFVRGFFHKFIKNLTTQQFEDAKFVHKYITDGTPKVNWREILCGTFKFTRSDLLVKVMQKIELMDLKRWYVKYLLPPGTGAATTPKIISEMRKLSIQVVGSDDKEFRIESIQHNRSERDNSNSELGRMLRINDSDYKVPLKPLKVLLPSKKSGIREKCIENISEFQRSLFAFPENHDPTY